MLDLQGHGIPRQLASGYQDYGVDDARHARLLRTAGPVITYE